MVRQPVPAADAFRCLTPVTAAYAIVPILDGFNWSWCAAQLDPGEWYLVVFRSVRRADADELLLEMHDYGAHLEAQRRADGLLFYFRGHPNEERACLSFCVWTDRENARAAARLPLHRHATSMTNDWFDSFRLERYRLFKRTHESPLEVESLGAMEEDRLSMHRPDMSPVIHQASLSG